MMIDITHPLDINGDVRIGRKVSSVRWLKPTIGWLKLNTDGADKGVLYDKKVPLKLKGKFYRSAIRSAMLYGSKCWAMKKSLESKLEVAEMRMLRWSCGRTLLDKIPNGVFRYALGVSPISAKCNVLAERSEIGLTNSTYTELAQLYEKYKDQDFASGQ
ncbi:hypothetical protein OROMI_019161 [Orobanche minor]